MKKAIPFPISLQTDNQKQEMIIACAMLLSNEVLQKFNQREVPAQVLPKTEII